MGSIYHEPRHHSIESRSLAFFSSITSDIATALGQPTRLLSELPPIILNHLARKVGGYYSELEVIVKVG